MNAAAQPDPFDWHRRALAGEKVPVHDGTPELGWFRTRRKVDGKYGEWSPAAIFQVPNGTVVAEIDGQEVNPVEAWTRLAKNPVSEEAYLARKQTGRWPDDAAAEMPSNPRARIGGNLPPEELPLEDPAGEEPTAAAEADPALAALLAQVEAAKDEARKVYAELKLDAPRAVADRAQNIRDQLKALSKRIDDLRKAEKQPYLNAERIIDDYYREPIALPLEVERFLAQRVDAWVKAERDRQRATAEAERQRIIEERRRQQEIEAEARRKAAKDAGDPEPPPAMAIEPQSEPPPVEEPKVLLGGGVSGRKTGLKKTVTAKIVDQDATYQFFRQHFDVVSVLQKLANQAIRKQDIPGCTRVTQESV